MSRAATRSTHPTTFVPLPAGGRIAVVDVPAAGFSMNDVPGLPVLLVPGYTGSKEDFAPILDPIAAAGHRVVAVDQRGQFESDGPDDHAAYAPDLLAADLCALVAELELGPVHLVGHSFGGLVSRAAVIAAAGSGAFVSLTLLDSGPAAVGGSRRSTTELLTSALRTMPIADVWDGIQAFWAAEGHEPMDPEAAAFQRDRFLGTTPAAHVGMGEALLTEPDRVAELLAAAGGLPIAVIYGEHDDAWLPDVQSAMATALGARDVAIPDAVHSPAYEQPRVLSVELLDFFHTVETAVSA